MDKKAIEEPKRLPEEKTILVDCHGKPLIVSVGNFVGFNPKRLGKKE